MSFRRKSMCQWAASRCWNLFGCAVAFAMGLSCGHCAMAEPWYLIPFQKLAKESDLVVIARPYNVQAERPSAVNSNSPMNDPMSHPFLVSRVLIGEGVQPGQLVLVENNDHLNGISRGKQFDLEFSANREGDPTRPEIKDVLLFLSWQLSSGNTDADCRLSYSGVRILSSDGRTFVPWQWGSFIDRRTIAREGWKEGDFHDMVCRIEELAPDIHLLQRLRRNLIAESGLPDYEPLNQTFFGRPVLSESLARMLDAHENLPPVKSLADQP